MGESLMDRSLFLKHQNIIGIGVILLLTFYALSFLLDILNIFGLRSLYSGLEVPLLWDLMFQERGPVEMFQWLFLGFFTITSAFLFGKLNEKGRNKEGIFWFLFSIAGVLMLMEDAGNIRHFLLRDHVVLGWTFMQSLETVYFGLLAAIPFAAVVRYGKYIKDSRTTVVLLALGFVFYGLAVFFSGPADLTNINIHIGDTFYEATASIGGEDLRAIYEETDLRLEEQAGGEGFMDISYRFIDHLIEESLELLGATFLLASAVSYLEFIKREE